MKRSRRAIASPPRIEFARITSGAALAARAGLEVHAGHGLDFVSAERIASLAEIAELNIGHFLIGEAVFGGLEGAMARMRAAMDHGRRTRATGTAS